MTENMALEIGNFEAHLRYERRLSPHTVTAYLTDVKQMADYAFTTYGITDTDSVKVLHLRSWLSSLKEWNLNNRSLKRKIAAQNAFFHFLMSEGKLTTNPAKRLLLPKADKPLPRFLEEKQTQRLSEQMTEPDDSFEQQTDWLLVELLYQTGMRRAELIQLNETDVHFSRKEIQVFGKGGKMRLVPVQKALLEQIKNYIELKKKLFVSPTKKVLSLKSGKPLYPNYVYRAVKRYLATVTTLDKKSPHILRHTFASQLLNNGADLMSIKDLLGHQSLAATQVYTHLNIERLKEVYKNAHPKS